MARVAPAPFEGLLVEAGRLLAASLVLDDTLRTVARLAVPELAGWAAVELVQFDGSRRRIASDDGPAGAVPGEALDAALAGEPIVLAGPPSWLVVPLAHDGGRILGALSLCRTDAAEPFAASDVPVGLELAERCAQAIDNARRYEEAESMRALLDTVLAAAPVGMAVYDREARYVFINERLAEVNGLRPAEHVGRPVADVLGEEHPALGILRAVLATGEPVQDADVLLGDRAFVVSYAPVEVEGRTVGAVSGIVEVTERHHAAAAVEASEARLRALVDSGLVGVAHGRGDRVVRANDALLDMLGITSTQVEAGELTTGCFSPSPWAATDAEMRRRLLRDGRIAPYEQEYRRSDGTRVPVLIGATMLPEARGEWVAVVVDLSERRAAERDRERLLERTARLQAVTEQLSAALTEDEVARVILSEGMAATGAVCGVLGLRADNRALRVEHRFGIAGNAPGLLPLDADAPMPEAARTGAPVLLHSRDEWLVRFPARPPRSDFEAFAAVPLLFEGGVTGVMGIGYPDRREFAAGDVEMLLAIARQGAQALERARLYEERAYVARTLQQGLLPRALPDIPGLEVAVRYRPVADGSEVGGDFYDVVGLPDGAWLASVGDICGKGTEAAVLTGVVRSTLRALALVESRPAELLRGVNEALRREDAPRALATVACAAVRPDGDGFAVRLAAGGHPPSLVLRADGRVEEVGALGSMLGVDDTPVLPECEVRLAPGDLLLLYTDGVIDARPPGEPPFGEARLHEVLATGAGRPAADVLGVVDGAVLGHAPGPPRDDTALLALRVPARD